MKQYKISRFMIMLGLALLCHTTLVAQKLTEEKLLGCWKLKSIEFLQPMQDSQNIINGSKNIVACFEKNGRFTTKLRTGDRDEIVGTGSFSIGADGKTLIQKRDADDGGMDEPAIVDIPNDREMLFTVEHQLIFHFERLPLK